MNPKKETIINDLKSRLSAHLGDNLKEIILFGSQLAESSNPNSDYDILIILRKNKNWKIEREISDICYEIDLKYEIITDTHILSEAEIHSPRGKQPIFYNALRHGYHVC